MRNPRGKLVGWPVLAVVVGVLLGAAAASGEAAELAGELVSASGPVEVRPLGVAVWRAAALKVVLHPGDMVRTGPGGAAEVAFVHGVFRMDENTVVILPPPQAVPAAAGSLSGIRLLLYRGRVLFQILKDRLQGEFDVITPSVIVGVKGTVFGVEQGATPGVVVFDGSVQVSLTGRPEAPPVTVGAGQSTVLVQGQLTPPQPYRSGAPGAMWGGAPTRTESAPLAAPPAGPAVTPAAPAGTPEGAAVLAVPALSQIGGAAAVSPAAFVGLNPPRLTAVGGPPGSSSTFATTGGAGAALSGEVSGSGGGRHLGLGQGGCPPGQHKKGRC